MAGKEEKKEEENKSDYLSIHKKRHYDAKKISDLHMHNTMKGYTTAVEKHLMKDGEIDFDLLDDDKVNKAMVDTMMELYTKSLEKRFGKAQDKFHEDVMLAGYMGITKDKLQDVFGKYGKKLNYELFPQIASSMNQQVKKHIYDTATSHLTQEDIPHVTKKLGLEGRLSIPLTLEETRDLLNAWQDNEEQLDERKLREEVGIKLKRKKKNK